MSLTTRLLRHCNYTDLQSDSLEKTTAMSLRFFLFGAAVLSLSSAAAPCQQNKTSGVSIVQPGAPGHSNKTLTPETATAAPRKPSEADIKFMQGMIMHHSQAVEMT